MVDSNADAPADTDTKDDATADANAKDESVDAEVKTDDASKADDTPQADADLEDRPPVLLVHEDREHLVQPGEEFGSDLGVLEVPPDVEPEQVLETHLGTEFQVRRLRGPDLFHHFERTGAPMVPRDVGLIIGETGVSVGDRVLDTGTGTGVLAASMARAGATVVSYERNAEFADVARENMTLGGVASSVDVRTGDLRDDLEELADGPGFDVLTLDTGNAPEIVAHAPDLLVDGGFVAVYSPFVETAREANEIAHEVGLSNVVTRETIQREMTFDQRGSRPSTAPVGHTGYLLFARAE